MATACNCTQSSEHYSVCLSWVHVYLLRSQHRFCGDLGKYFLSAWWGTEGRSLVIRPSSWLIDQQQFRKATASIILTRQSDEGFNCSQTPTMTHLVNIHGHAYLARTASQILSYLSKTATGLSSCLLHSILQWQKNILGTVKRIVLPFCWIFTAKCQNQDTYKANSAQLSLGYP